jgi:hypothetical protein
MDLEKVIKIYWIIGIIVLGLYGLWLFISPESYWAMTNSPYFSPVARIIGSLYIAWLIVMIMLYKELDNWEKIKPWMVFSVISNILSFISFIIAIVVYNMLSASTLVAMILNLFFAIGALYIIMQKR